MPKDKSKTGKKKHDEKDAARDAVEAIRSAFERTLATTAGGAQETRDRAQGLLDEIGAAAARVRQAVEQVDLLDELRGLRGEIETLARRVTALERSSAPAGEGAGEDTSAATTAAVKPAARRGAAKASKSAKGKRAAKGAGKAAKGTRATKRSGTAKSAGTAVAKGTGRAAKRGAAKGAGKRAPATETADDAGSGRS